MLSIAWDEIMDLIGGIKYMENKPSGRRPNYGKAKSVQNNGRNDVAKAENAPAVANHPSTEGDMRLGQKVDTTA